MIEMATTKQDIVNWLERGKEEGARWVVIICDTYDYDDYPVYIRELDELRLRVGRAERGENMMRLMEVYDLEQDIEEQKSEHRAMRLP